MLIPCMFVAGLIMALRIIQHWIPIVRFFQNLVFLKLKSIAGFRMIRSIM